jgi:acyl-CoA synthetase
MGLDRKTIFINSLYEKKPAFAMNRILTILDVELAREFYARGYWKGDTLYAVLSQRAARAPDRVFLRDTDSCLTYREALRWVDAIAQDLSAAGVRPGDRVSIWLPSRIETALVFLACSRMGYVCNTSLHRDYTCAEILAAVGLWRRWIEERHFLFDWRTREAQAGLPA